MPLVMSTLLTMTTHFSDVNSTHHAGMYGQLGHGNTEKQSVPREVEALADKAVYLLACGNFHTVRALKCMIIVHCINW